MAAAPFASGLYLGQVMHHRVRPVRHRLSYRVFSLLADLDELPRLDRALRLFAHNHFGLIGFNDRDFGPLDGEYGALKGWAEGQLAAAGIEGGGPVRLLCFPRVLGFVFNPLSVWFCHRRDGSLAAIIHEVSNTFGQRHAYLIPAAPGPDGLVRQRCDKGFYVSPFMDMETAYHFRIRPPGGEAGEPLAVSIRQTDAEGPVLHAALTATRVELTDGAILGAWARHPLMTAKVVAGIHWEALHLWRKGLAIRPRPPAPAHPVTVVKAVLPTRS
ncbi:hypothetical protein AZL_d01870 (plasmid) [Azospirillum sp. B510]|uniref:DUF1365 domain-containing protein n=1 Tax=Azospirillum sp. (strain B510) TaxID=137722 RepID=UPI0001C4C619|nr:DUF1365 domain-containing protein [Azospirillum sp. B510]BAI76013.1 hypothetical protein AZL_d01870 [Azospirillum sp. B510]